MTGKTDRRLLRYVVFSRSSARLKPALRTLACPITPLDQYGPRLLQCRRDVRHHWMGRTFDFYGRAPEHDNPRARHDLEALGMCKKVFLWAVTTRFGLASFSFWHLGIFWAFGDIGGLVLPLSDCRRVSAQCWLVDEEPRCGKQSKYSAVGEGLGREK